MKRNKYLTNQELLKELEQRIPDFTEDEFTTLTLLLGKFYPRFMKIFREIDPHTHQFIQERHKQLVQEKTDKEIEKIKKSLPDKK